MVLSLYDNPDRTKTPTRSKPSRRVRCVAKVRGFTDSEAEFSKGDSWISVKKPNGEDSESVTLSFKEQQPTSRKESYELDYCYDQYEDNGVIFSREVKPLIPGVLGGCNATVVALGARCSGKTCLIQGSAEKPGLAALAMAEIFLASEKDGNSVTISSYEVYQDHVYDILDPERRLVLVQGDVQGKIRLKGLSRVPVKSVSEFYNLYVSGCASCKRAQKVATELPRRGHKGLIVHVSSPSESSDALHVGKLNFVDLAGYEGTRSRRKSVNGLNLVETGKIHKSIYAMLNVVHALSASGNHVPYRESKLTHLLQDSLRGANRVLMVTCLKPTFCQDSMYMVSLVSRSCQNNNGAVMESSKKTKCLTRSAVVPSRKGHIPQTIVATTKKQTISRAPLSEKKINCSMTPVSKGRKLFDVKNQLTKSKKGSSISDIATSETSVDKEEMSVSSVTEVAEPSVENTLSDELKPLELTSMGEKDNLSSDAPKHAESILMAKKDVSFNSDAHTEKHTPRVNSRNDFSLLEEVHHVEKEGKNSDVNDEKSPPISSRLQELSNNLKNLLSATPVCKKISDASKTDCSATPLCIKMREENDASSNNVEPKTPANQGMKDNRCEVTNVNSPWEALSVRNSEVKHSLVQEYLGFLNTASKEELKRLKGIGEKRATYIMELRDESPKPFKNLDDLEEIGLSAKQIKGLMKKEFGGLFN
ncbi:kinesin-like protein KIF22 [Pyrus ussuriensis x Pyrus communis]|uniref:Kinesin-like protein KIF22 n=1 Tax=Pyrus ussuriensis x Pyrus communis TaxID=2448454 RepID=A0A5N5F6L1_9ROSA|nr:kinesin-like protein KIF22 [Pyrus ussuriensis x Pyrus communis]